MNGDRKIGCDIEAVVIIIVVASLIVMFAGEPDIHDGIIYRLFEGNVPAEASEQEVKG